VVGHGTFSNLGRTSNPAGQFSVYEGGFLDTGTWPVGPSYETMDSRGFSSFTNLSQYHTQAWDRTKPIISKGNLAQFIYELRDLPRQLQTTANLLSNRWVDLTRGHGKHGLMLPYMQPREVADQFINHEFGWKPFIGDIVKLLHVYNHSIEYIANLVRDNGVFVRRRRVLEESDVVTNFPFASRSMTQPDSDQTGPDGTPLCQILSSPAGSGTGYCHFTTRTRKRVWAVGSFKYYRPELDPALFDGNSFDLLNSLHRLLTLYGARISPTLLYKITPWTWAIDWFTNLGKHIERFDDFVQDGIVSRYLFVMNHEEMFYTKTSILNFFSGPITLNFERHFFLKQREVADSPYGFGTPWNTMTPRQWAILGALGITRMPGGFISRGA
jgi:hypothetical protein